MAEFAKAQLLKYGWTEGKGLGKNETGITEAVKPKLKFDSAGIGFKDTDYNNEWWAAAFNDAARSINVTTQSNGVSISVSKEHSTEFPKNSRETNSSSTFGSFLKKSTLFGNDLVQEKYDAEENVENKIVHVSLTDEELFKACGGRTAHKGARHGITLSGRSKRIAQQDKEMLSSSIFAQPSKKSRTEEREVQEREYGMDSNANTILPLTPLPIEDPISPKLSKCKRKRYKREMHDLTHQLINVCKINDDDEETNNNSSDNTATKKKSELKRKRRKDKRKGKVRSNSADGIPREAADKGTYDILFPGSEDEGATRRRKIQNQEALQELTDGKKEDQTSNIVKLDQGSVYSNKKKKSKRKRRQNHNDGTPMQTDTTKIVTPTICNCSTKKKKKITNEYDEFRKQHLKNIARLNHRITKKNRRLGRKKRKFHLKTITESLNALHFVADQPNKSSTSTQKKLETIVEGLMAVYITENKTEEMKKLSKKNKKPQ